MKVIFSIGTLKVIFLLTFLVKAIIFFSVWVFKPKFFFMGGDADYYNEYALGLFEIASSAWPDLLKALDSIGFYNRSIISLILFILASLIIPFLFASLLPTPISNTLKKSHRKTYWFIATIIAIYPTIFFYSLDIYRDVFMVFLVGICFRMVNTFVSAPFKITKSILFLIFFSLSCYLLFLFRPYLGLSIFAAFFFYSIKLSDGGIIFLTISYFVLLALLNAQGILDPLFFYRDIFSNEFPDSGSNINLGIKGKTSIEFIVLYLYSVILQLFGFYITSIKALLLFIAESVTFIFCVFYTIRNRRFLTPFLRYLLFFSFVYGTVWIIGNDNLGTATRLRVFNYLVMLIITASIYLKKYYVSRQNEAPF